MAAAVEELRRAGAHIDDTARPVHLGEASDVFEKLFAAAVSPGAYSGLGNHVNEHRQQLPAQWRQFFTRYDAVLTPVSPVAAITTTSPGPSTAGRSR